MAWVVPTSRFRRKAGLSIIVSSIFRFRNSYNHRRLQAVTNGNKPNATRADRTLSPTQTLPGTL